MTDEELRLECMKLARQYDEGIDYARKIYEFATGRSDAVTVTEGDHGVTVAVTYPKNT